MVMKKLIYIVLILLSSNLISDQAYAEAVEEENTCAKALGFGEELRNFYTAKNEFLKDPSPDSFKKLIKLYKDLLKEAEGIPNRALHRDAYKGDISAIRFLVSNNDIPVDVRGQGGRTPLSVAAMFGHIEAIDALLDLGADINAPDATGNSPLIYVVRRGQADAVEHLIRRRADINKANLMDEAPVMLAVRLGYQDIFHTLASYGANLMSTNTQGWTLLHTAISYSEVTDRVGMIEIILDKVTILEPEFIKWPERIYGNSPLHQAASYGLIDVIRALLQRGAPLGAKNKDGELPIHVAARFDQLEAFVILMNANPTLLKAADKKGQTPIGTARAHNSQRIVTVLSRLGL